MANVEESKVFNSLLSLRTSGTVSLGGREISIKIEPVDNHLGDSPDFFLWLEVELTVFSQHFRVRVPIPVEAEKGGIYGGAIEDLDKFTARARHPIELPMLVVAEAGYDVRQERRELPAIVTMMQIPLRALEG